MHTIEMLDVDTSYINILKKANITTIEKLISMSESEVVTILNIVSPVGFSVVRNALMNKSYLFDFDKIRYKQYNIPDEYIFIKVDDLHLSTRLIHALKNSNIKYLGDLLTTNYIKIIRLRNVGNNSIKELRDYVHKLGFNFPDERDSYKDKIAKYQAQNIPLLKDALNISNTVANALYRADIFTVEDLISYGPKVFKLYGIGKMGEEEIKNAMANLGITFQEKETILLGKEHLSEKEIENEKLVSQEIKTRVEKKEELLKKFNALMEERKELLKKEKELDELILNAIKEYKQLGVNDGIRR